MFGIILCLIYILSRTGIYYPAGFDTLKEYRECVDNMPINDAPEVFGMHENANIAFQVSGSARWRSVMIYTHQECCSYERNACWGGEPRQVSTTRLFAWSAMDSKDKFLFVAF